MKPKKPIVAPMLKMKRKSFQTGGVTYRPDRSPSTGELDPNIRDYKNYLANLRLLGIAPNDIRYQAYQDAGRRYGATQSQLGNLEAQIEARQRQAQAIQNAFDTQRRAAQDQYRQAALAYKAQQRAGNLDQIPQAELLSRPMRTKLDDSLAKVQSEAQSQLAKDLKDQSKVIGRTAELQRDYDRDLAGYQNLQYLNAVNELFGLRPRPIGQSAPEAKEGLQASPDINRFANFPPNTDIQGLPVKKGQPLMQSTTQMKKGGSVKPSRGDGIARKGKTKGRFI